jgi:uncharacterized membrane protein
MPRTLDVVLNCSFVFLVVLFVTGGIIWEEKFQGKQLRFEVSSMDAWVLGFLVLLLWRYLCGWRGTSGGIACVRFLRRLGGRLSCSSRSVYCFTALWAVLLIAVAIRRHLAFGSGAYDLGIFDQALWNTTQGDLLFSSIKGDVILFADHFDPLQLLLVPFYWLVPSPLLLLIAQGSMLALGALPLYWLACERFPGSVLAPLFPVLYLFYLPLRNVNRFDYHPTAFVPALVLFALYYMEKAKWPRMILFLIMAGLCKENMPAAGMTVGLYLVFAKRKRLLGAALFILFGLWFYAGPTWIVPAFNPGGYQYWHRYAPLGSSVSEILLTLLFHPLTALSTIVTGRKLVFVWKVFGPVALLPFLAPSRLLLGLPFLAQHLLSSVDVQTSIGFHYTAELIPFVFFSALWGASCLLSRLPQTRIVGHNWEGESPRRALAAFLLAMSFLFHGRPESFHLRWYRPTPHLKDLSAVLQMIPPEASVSAQQPIAPHLSHRKFLYLFPDLGPGGQVRVEYVILDSTLDRWPARATFTQDVAALSAKGYDQILGRDNILLFRKQRLPVGH